MTGRSVSATSSDTRVPGGQCSYADLRAFICLAALTIAAEGSKPDVAKPKSTQGIKTPKHEIDLIRDRLKRLKEVLR